MCLSFRYSAEQLQAVKPTKRFYAYKLLNVDSNVFKSPVYPSLMPQTGWIPGEHVARLGSSDAGFYVMLCPPGLSISNYGRNQRVVRIEVNPEDVLFGGPDNFLGRPASCLVCSKVTLTEVDYEDLKVDGNNARVTEEMKEIIKKAVKKVKAVKKTAVDSAKKATKKAKTTAKKTAATLKKVAKKAAKTKKTAVKVKKVAAKKVKKTKKPE